MEEGRQGSTEAEVHDDVVVDMEGLLTLRKANVKDAKKGKQQRNRAKDLYFCLLGGALYSYKQAEVHMSSVVCSLTMVTCVVLCCVWCA